MNEIEIITEINGLLKGVQEGVNANLTMPQMPSTFVIGCPRSGTTALMQYLSATGTWSYPTNLLTRFSSSVYLGSLIQELLFNSTYGLIDSVQVSDFSSEYGRSKGALNVNEFFHFFRRFFPNEEIRHLSKSELEQVDIQGLLKELASLEAIQSKPFISKGLMFQSNLDYFYKKMPHNVFLYIKRKPKFVMQSIYKARMKECHSVNDWWSAKPAMYNRLAEEPIEKQIAGQVFYIQQEIENSLVKIPEENKLIVTYDDFINAPSNTYKLLLSKYEELGVRLTEFEANHSNLITSNEAVTIDKSIFKLMEKTYHQF